jgi:ATP/maltotriose-dependent transcriptional regulator MalT
MHASHWHWTQVEGVTAENISIAYWQAARVYALLGEADNARRYAACCLEVSGGEDVEPFYLAYAHEAAARAAAIAGDTEAMQTHLDEAARIAATLEDEDSRTQLKQDLATIG